MIESLPCASCAALCCGPVPLSRERIKKIRAYVKLMPKAERRRLATQKRGELDCGFLDKERNCCPIYPVRPWVCEAFGRVEGMQCCKVSGLVKIIPEFLVDTKFEEENESGVVENSGCFYWR